MADGSIVISTELDDKKAQAELNRLVAKIDELNGKIKQAEDARFPLVERAAELGAQLDAAKAKLAEMQEAPAGIYSDEQIAKQKETVGALQTLWNGAQSEVEKYDQNIAKSTEQLALAQNKAGELASRLSTGAETAEQLGEAGTQGSNMFADAMGEVERRVQRVTKRISRLITRVLFFSVITRALRGVRTWFSNVLKSSDEASAAMARLKGALLTMAQPLVNYIIPAFTKFVSILAQVVNAIAAVVSRLFGTTASASAEAAENLYNEQNAIKGVGGAAKKASKQLAAFDEINQLSNNSGGGGGGESAASAPDFSGAAGADKWLDDMLNGVEEKVTLGLLLGGVALIALGAALGNLALVLAGLGLIGAGLALGTEEGVIDDWAKKLGLDSAEEFVTAALLIAGMAAIVFGIVLGNILLFVAGAALLGAGLVYGGKKGVLTDWVKKLQLNSVFDYVTAAMTLVGIALVAIGAALGNIGLVIAGAVILALGVTADAVGEETLKAWWEKLKLTSVQQWVGVITMLAGIALIAIGVAMANIFMVLGGMALVGLATVTNTSNNNLRDWVQVLGLEKVAGWVTGALLLGGIALIVIGIVTANIPMVLAGLGLLGAGISIGITSGTFQSWLDTISGAFVSFKNSIVATFEELYDKVKGYINALLGGVETMANGIVNGINKAIDALNALEFTVPDWVPLIGGSTFGFNIPRLNTISIPRLAQGAVIPPNREFLAVLGDQKSGTNIEAPLDTLVQAFRQANAEMGRNRPIQVILEVDRREFGRVVYEVGNEETQRVGVKFSGVTG